jgi:hypothetical protein
MPEWILNFLKIILLSLGLIVIYIGLDELIAQTKANIQTARDNDASAYIVTSYISNEPFGKSTNVVKRGTQIFYNMQIERQPGKPCFVRTSWLWVLHLPTGNSVLWNTTDGEFYSGDRTESLAQAVQIPEKLPPGDYTLSRLAIFKCGNVEDFAKTVRNVDLRVE